MMCYLLGHGCTATTHSTTSLINFLDSLSTSAVSLKPWLVSFIFFVPFLILLINLINWIFEYLLNRHSYLTGGRALYHATLQWFFILIVYPYKISTLKLKFKGLLWGGNIFKTGKPEEICFLGFDYFLYSQDLRSIVDCSFFSKKYGWNWFDKENLYQRYFVNK